MVPDKSPGTDGIPCEFYKVFWKDVAEILINSFNYSYEIGKLSVSQRNSVIKYTKAKNMPGLRLFLDFEKASDTLEWPFIRKTFEHFGFGPSLLNWLKVFYCNSESCILNDGRASNFFELNRGVKQGCPLSPYLFILSVEVLANAIRPKRRFVA